MLDLSRLSPAQRQAVLAGDGPLLIVAGPGSGKTTVLAARIAYLVAGRGCPPSSILAIAFTTRATRELRTRLGDLLGAPGRAVEVATFHAFGLRIVRQWCAELGLGPGPLAVYGADEARAVLRDVAAAEGIDLTRWPLGDLARELERFRLHGSDSSSVPLGLLRSLAAGYEECLRRRGAVDYPAMLALPLRLFATRPEARRLYQDCYRHVLADEFQDVCAAQYLLLRQLAARHRNLVVVGDPCQTLYPWRGADVRFLDDFQRDFPEARVIHLNQNFRSSGQIVEVANALGARLADRDDLWTTNPPGEPAFLHVAPSDQAEAAFIAGQIARLRAEQIVTSLGEVAVLYRTNQQATALTLALRERHLPYRVRGSGDLFARREVRDLVAYLRLVHDPRDPAALALIVNVPPRRLGRLAETLRSHPISLDALCNRAAHSGPVVSSAAEGLRALVGDLHARCGEISPAALLDLILDQTGYGAWLATQTDGVVRLGYVATLREVLVHAGGDLGAWLADFQLGEDAGPFPDDAERVLLTSIHGAKGGEWRIVFVAGVEEGLLPHYRTLTSQAGDPAGIEEELRVAYVAVTRPRERLYVTCARARQRAGRSERCTPSRFLTGLPVERIDRTA